jgi:multiple sugar transport system permease protein
MAKVSLGSRLRLGAAVSSERSPEPGPLGAFRTVLTSRSSGVTKDQARAGFLFIAPAMLLFLVFTLLPVLFALGLSFTDYDIITTRAWVGLDNYRRLLLDTVFTQSLRNILYYCALFVPSMVALSLGLALALSRARPGVGLFRTVYYLPAVTSSVAAATTWMWLLNRDFGPINQLLSYVGISGPAWLSQSNTAMLAIVFVTLWQGVGGNMLIYLAGLRGIPKPLFEAAAVDGAGAWQTFWRITWPSLWPTTYLVATISLINAFQLFDQAYVMTQGGPGRATLTPVFVIYNNGFERLQMGYASAQAFLLFLIIAAITIVNVGINRRYAVERGPV